MGEGKGTDWQLRPRAGAKTAAASLQRPRRAHGAGQEVSARVARDAPRGLAEDGQGGATDYATASPRQGGSCSQYYCKFTVNLDWAPLGGGENLVFGGAGPKLIFAPAPRGNNAQDKYIIIKLANYKCLMVECLLCDRIRGHLNQTVGKHQYKNWALVSERWEFDS